RLRADAQGRHSRRSRCTPRVVALALVVSGFLTRRSLGEGVSRTVTSTGLAQLVEQVEHRIGDSIRLAVGDEVRAVRHALPRAVRAVRELTLCGFALRFDLFRIDEPLGKWRHELLR